MLLQRGGFGQTTEETTPEGKYSNEWREAIEGATAAPSQGQPATRRSPSGKPPSEPAVDYSTLPEDTSNLSGFTYGSNKKRFEHYTAMLNVASALNKVIAGGNAEAARALAQSGLARMSRKAREQTKDPVLARLVGIFRAIMTGDDPNSHAANLSWILKKAESEVNYAARQQSKEERRRLSGKPAVEISGEGFWTPAK